MESTVSIDHEKWLQLRRKGIGGSDAAAVCGLSRWKTPLTVYLEKIGEIPSNQPDNEYMYWGRVLEEVVAREFEKRTHLKVRRVNHVIYHKVHKFMIANIDRKIANENALLECKTASQFHEDEWKDGKIPQEYLLQVHHYLAVTGFSRAYIAALLGGHTFIIQKIDRDPEIIDYLIKIESEFWHMVETRTPPAIDGSDESTRLLNLLYPHAVEDSIELDNTLNATIEERNRLAEKIKELERLKNEKENLIKYALKEHETGKTNKYIVSWKNISSIRLDTKALKKDHQEIYQEYAKPVEYRRLMIKEMKGNE